MNNQELRAIRQRIRQQSTRTGGLKGIKLVLCFGFFVILPLVAFGRLVFELDQLRYLDELDYQLAHDLGRVDRTRHPGGRPDQPHRPSANHSKTLPQSSPQPIPPPPIGAVTVEPAPSPVNRSWVYQGLDLDFNSRVDRSSLNEAVKKLGPLPNMMARKHPPHPPEIKLPAQNRVIFERPTD